MVVPLGTRVLIERVVSIDKNDQGLMIDESQMRAPQSIKAEVKAIGEEVKIVKVGNTVLVSQFGPTEAKEKMFDKTLIVAEEDILAIIVPDKAAK